MITKDIKDVIKAATALTSTSGQSLLMKDSNGSLGAIAYSEFGFTDLAGAEAANTNLDIKDFTEKYVKGKRIGHKLTDQSYSNSTRWYVKIGDIHLNMQSYIVEVTKNRLNLSQPWACITLVFYPANANGTPIYMVNQQTGESKNDYSIAVKSIGFNAVALS